MFIYGEHVEFEEEGVTVQGVYQGPYPGVDGPIAVVSIWDAYSTQHGPVRHVPIELLSHSNYDPEDVVYVVTYFDQIDNRRIREEWRDHAQAERRYRILCKATFAHDVGLQPKTEEDRG